MLVDLCNYRHCKEAQIWKTRCVVAKHKSIRIL